MGAGAGAARTILGLQSPTWIARRYAGSRVTPLVLCRAPQKGCASQDGKLSKQVGRVRDDSGAQCAVRDDTWGVIISGRVLVMRAAIRWSGTLLAGVRWWVA